MSRMLIIAALLLVIALLVWEDATEPAPAATNPIETAPGATQTARVEYRFWPTPRPSRTPRPTSTPLRFVRTAIVRTEEAAVLRTATAIIGRTATPAMAADVEGAGT